MPAQQSGPPKYANMETLDSLCTRAFQLQEQQNFAQALDAFFDALAIATTDRHRLTLLINITGCLQDLNRYEDALRHMDQCLVLLNRMNDDEPLKRNFGNLQQERVVCLFYLGRFAEADTLATELLTARLLLDFPDNYAEITRIRHLAKWNEEARNAKKGQEESEIEMFRHSAWQGLHDYRPQGHHAAEPAFSSAALERLHQAGSIDISLLYCGVGDARHIFSQLHHVDSYLQHRTTGSSRSERDVVFITADDISPAIIARDLILLHCLHEVGKEQTELQNERNPEQSKDPKIVHHYETKRFYLALFWYAYSGAIMPKIFYEELLTIMRKYQSAESVDIPWIQMDLASLRAVRKALKAWIDTNDLCAVEQAPELTRIRRVKNYETGWFFIPCGLKAFRNECDLFDRSFIILPPRESWTSEMCRIFFCKFKNWETKIIELKDHAKKEWHPNPLLYDPELRCLNICRNVISDVLEDITKLLEYAAPSHLEDIGKPEGYFRRHRPNIMEAIFPFLEGCSRALTKPKEVKVTIELRVGDAYSMLDAIRRGVLANRPDAPTRYDALFLSNIPKYGGRLATALYAFPLLKEGKKSFVHSNSMTASNHWVEYFGAVRSDFETVFELKYAEDSTIVDGYGQQSLMQPNRWAPPVTKNEKKLSKEELHDFLISMFLRLAVPFRRFTGNKHTRIDQPLTLHAWIRLCSYLTENRGYPKHWICRTVTTILSAVNPQIVDDESLDIEEIETIRAMVPFVTELRSLLRRQCRQLLFPLLDTLHPVYKYTISFCLTDWTLALIDLRVLSVIFINGNEKPRTRLWAHFMNGSAPALIMVFGNFEWDGDWSRPTEGKSVNAAVWAEKAYGDLWKEQGWKAWLVRTDTWDAVCSEGVEAHRENETREEKNQPPS